MQVTAAPTDSSQRPGGEVFVLVKQAHEGGSQVITAGVASDPPKINKPPTVTAKKRLAGRTMTWQRAGVKGGSFLQCLQKDLSSGDGCVAP